MSHTTQILSHLKREPITAMQALNMYGCMRLASRINDLRNQGHVINTEIVSNGEKKWARYHLAIKKPLK